MAEEEKLLKSKDVAHILDCSSENVMEYKRRMEEVAYSITRWTWSMTFAG